MKLPRGIVNTASRPEYWLAMHTRAATWAGKYRAMKNQLRAREWAGIARDYYARYLTLKEAGL